MAKNIPENPERKKDKIQYATQSQIAELLNTTEFEIKKLIRVGFPRAGNNKFIPKQCIAWYLNYLRFWNDNLKLVDIAAIMGVSERTVQRFVIEKNIPKKERGAYRMDVTISSYINHLKEQVKIAEEGERSITDERKRLLKMQADVKEMELLQLNKTLFPVEAAKQMVSEITTIVSKKLDAMPGMDLNKKFSCKTKEELLKVEKEIVHKIKTELSNAESKINEKPDSKK